MSVILWALAGYAFGSFPSAWLVATAAGRRHVLDSVRRTVGEADAHVLLKQAGGRAAALAAALDVLKGFVPVLLAVRSAGPYAVGACAVGAVAGHCWPPLFSRLAGRGLATTAGAFLAFLPVEMVGAGVVRTVGHLVGAGGISSTVGFLSVPLAAWWRRQPAPYVAASAAMNLVIVLRRLEGVSEDVALGVPAWRAVLRRALLDSSAVGTLPSAE